MNKSITDFYKHTQFYIVGGYVRDILLYKNPHDIDLVAVGTSPDEMKSLGFKSTGKNFPVFRHPKTNIEIALARKEIKTGNSHTDFKFEWKNVTLEDDLIRRDFTCNALAYPVDFDIQNGIVKFDTFDIDKIIDYHNGLEDTFVKEIKVVCPEHFIEDPLRILRFCRFLAQLDFEASDETYSLISDMVSKGMLNNLTKERVWMEFDKALQPGVNTRKFIESMHRIGALKIILPEIDRLYTLKENPKYHSGGTTFNHIMKALDVAKDFDCYTKWGVLVHDIGKYNSYNKTYSDYEYYNKELGNIFKSIEDYKIYCREHQGTMGKWFYPHDDEDSIKLVRDVCNRIIYGSGSKNLYIKTACNSVKYHMRMWNIFDGMSSKKIYKILKSVCGNSCQTFEHLNRLLNICKADNESDKTKECRTKYKNAIFLRMIYEKLFDICSKLQLSTIISIEKISKYSGETCQMLIDDARRHVIKLELNKFIEEYNK